MGVPARSSLRLPRGLTYGRPGPEETTPVPTYAYACTACGHAFDAVQKFSDSALTECPDCGGRLRKVYTSIGVSFKGSGFYRNDSRASGTGSGNGSGTTKGS